MPEHKTTVVVTTVRLPTAVKVVDGRDKDRDSRVVVAHPAVLLEDEANLVPIVVISVAYRVTIGRSVLFVPIRDHLYHLGALIARVGLLHFRVRRDRSDPSILVSPPLRLSNSTSTSIVLRRSVTRVICQDIRHHPGVRAPIKL